MRKIVPMSLGIAVAATMGAYLLYRAAANHAPIGFAYTPNQDIHETTGNFGTDFSRIDSQTTFKIPEGKSSEVYAYLRKTYSANNDFLKNAFPHLNLEGQPQEDISDFVDDYFDTVYLDLYQSHNTVRFRHRENIVNKNDSKSGRELVQVKITPPGHFDLRNELKFKAKPEESRTIDKKGIALLDIVTSSQQEDFKAAVAPISPHDLRYILTLKQTRSRIYLNWDKENFLSFSVDAGGASIWNKKGVFSSVDIGLVETAYTEGDEDKRVQMQKIRAFIVDDLQKHFPGLTKNSEDKYVVVLSQIMSQIPFFKYLRLVRAL